MINVPCAILSEDEAETFILVSSIKVILGIEVLIDARLQILVGMLHHSIFWA